MRDSVHCKLGTGFLKQKGEEMDPYNNNQKTTIPFPTLIYFICSIFRVALNKRSNKSFYLKKGGNQRISNIHSKNKKYLCNERSLNSDMYKLHSPKDSSGVE